MNTMQLFSQYLSWGIALISVAKIAYDYWSATPKIVSTIITVSRCSFMHGETAYAWFSPYLYVINKHKTAVHLRDFKMRVLVDRKWIELEPMWNAKSLAGVGGGAEEDFIMGETTYHKWRDTQIRLQHKAVDFGSPVEGWVVFLSKDASLNNVKPKLFEVTCVDAFRNKHVTRIKYGELEDMAILVDMGIIDYTSRPASEPPKQVQVNKQEMPATIPVQASKST